MHIQFLDYLVDPKTHEALELQITQSEGDEIIEGQLRSPSNTYPIRDGVPRFVVDEGYSGNFGYQWNKWSRVQFDSENIGKPFEGHTTQMWEKITHIPNTKSLEGECVLDIGCGPGRFIEVARKKGAKVIGIDYSRAINAARESFRDDSNVLLCQADALQLPLRSNSLDGAFTIGVLHHTPNPKKGVSEAARVLKDRGWFGLAVYSKGSFYDFPTVQMWRNIFKTLTPYFGHSLPLLYTYLTINFLRPIARVFPLGGKAIRVFFPFANFPDKDWSLLDTFDAVTPSYQSSHNCFEVYTWFKQLGFTEIEPSQWSATAFHGKKSTTPNKKKEELELRKAS